LWSALVSAGDDDDSLAGGFPGLFIRLCRRAAALEQLTQSGACERRTIRRVADMVAVLWDRPLLISTDWQRLFFQCLKLFLEGHPLRAQLPDGAGIQMSTLASMAMQIRQALVEGDEGNAVLKSLVDEVCGDSRFPLWTGAPEKIRQSPATPPDGFDEYLFSTRGEPPRSGAGGGSGSVAVTSPPPKPPKTPASSPAPAIALPTGKRKRKSR